MPRLKKSKTRKSKIKKSKTKKIIIKSKLNLWKIMFSVTIGLFLTTSSSLFLAYTLKVFDKKEVIKKFEGQEISLTSFQKKLESASEKTNDRIYVKDVIFKPQKNIMMFTSVNENVIDHFKVYMNEQWMTLYNTENLLSNQNQVIRSNNLSKKSPYHILYLAQIAPKNKPNIRFVYEPIIKKDNKDIPLIILGGLSFILPIWFIYIEIKYLHKYKYLLKNN